MGLMDKFNSMLNNMGGDNEGTTLVEQQRQDRQARQDEMAAKFNPEKDLGEVAIDTKNGILRLKTGAFSSQYYLVDTVTGYELLEDGGQVTKGGLGAAAVGGVLLGPAGLIAGSVLGRKTKKTVDNLTLQVTFSDLDNPTAEVVYISSPVKQTSVTYKTASQKAREAAAAIDVIVRANESAQSSASNASSDSADPYEEVKKLKELLDMGIISEEEFETKKKDLLGL